MDVFKIWLEANQDFLIVGVFTVSVVAGMLVEFSKKAWKPLEKKFSDDELKAAQLDVCKAWICQVLGVVLVVIFLKCITESIVIPGGKAALPIWFAADYMLQFVVSCYGLKAIKRFLASQKEKPVKPKMVRAVRDPETGELVEV